MISPYYMQTRCQKLRESQSRGSPKLGTQHGAHSMGAAGR